MGLTDRKDMAAGSGKLLNEDDTDYDFTAGFRALVGYVGNITTGTAGVVAAIAASTVQVLASLADILANGVLILTQVSRGVVDVATGAMIGITEAHHEIHEGNHFYMEGFMELENNGVLRVKLVTPDTEKWIRLTWEIVSTGVLTTTFDEGASGGMAGGAGVTPLNNDRNSLNASGLVLTSGVAAAVGYDTRVSNQKFGVASTPSKAVGGSDVRTNEIILKQNTTYLRTFTSGSNGNIVGFRASWYELANLE